MVSGTACRPGPAEPFSVTGVARGASASRREWTPLRRSDDFKRILSSGRKSRRGGVTVVVGPGQGSVPRVGFVVGKGVGNAVARNRAKRRLRHALAATPLEHGMDYVIIADRRAVDSPFTDLGAWLRDALEA